MQDRGIFRPRRLRSPSCVSHNQRHISGRVSKKPSSARGHGSASGNSDLSPDPHPGAHSLAASLCLQEGVTSQTSHWSRLYFMTFYIVTMVGLGPQVLFLQLPVLIGRPLWEDRAGDMSERLRSCSHPSLPSLTPSLCLAGGDDYHRGLHPRGLCLPNELQPQEPGLGRSVQGTGALAACWPAGNSADWLSSLLTVQLTYLAYLSGSLISTDYQIFKDRHTLLISFFKMKTVHAIV